MVVPRHDMWKHQDMTHGTRANLESDDVVDSELDTWKVFTVQVMWQLIGKVTW
jgi:hypothetical protein